MQTGSKVLSRMDPPAFGDSKKRKIVAMSQNDDAEMKSSSSAVKQSMSVAIAPLSTVRFKDPGSNVFEYHHFVRRIQTNDFTITGATNSTTTYDLNRNWTQLVSDYAELSAIFSRYRITRMVWHFVPVITDWTQGASTTTKPMVSSWVNRHSDYNNMIPSTWGDQIDDCTAQMQDAGKPFTIDYSPFIAATTDELAGGASYIVKDGRQAPWIPVTNSAITHLGGQVIGYVTLNTGSEGVYSQKFAVFVTTYFDCDSIQ